VRSRVRRSVRSEVDRSVVVRCRAGISRRARKEKVERAQNPPTVGSNSSCTPISANDGNFSSTGQVSPNTE